MAFEPFPRFLWAPSLRARAGMAFEPFLLSYSIPAIDLSLLLGVTSGFLCRSSQAFTCTGRWV